ncbi:MAG TPA: glycosyl hydrolase, partial [Rubrivivax sp.]|nr:glycosyl hydrolase [Rubrivivax sp.]
MRSRRLACAALLLWAATATATEPLEMPPPEPREFRAAWVATVANIDWPSQPGLPADRQRAEA